MNLCNFIFLWSIAILITGAQYGNGIELGVIEVVMWSILVGFSESFFTFIITYFGYHYYVKEVKKMFYKEIEEKQEQLEVIANVQIKQISNSNVMIDQTEIKYSENSQNEDEKINNQLNEESKNKLIFLSIMIMSLNQKMIKRLTKN